MMSERKYTLDEIATACMQAEVSDGQYESISLELMKADPVDESQPDAQGWKKNTGKQPVADEAPVVPASPALPQWIESQKGRCPETDALIEYIEKQGAASPAPVTAITPGFEWPKPPPRTGQSHVLFDDGYGEGWAKAIDTVRAALSSAPMAQAEPFGIYVERDDGTTEFQRTGKAFQPTAHGYKAWTLYATPPDPVAAINDEQIERAALEHVAPGWKQMAAVLGKQDDYRQTEQFRRLKDFAHALAATPAVPAAPSEREEALRKIMAAHLFNTSTMLPSEVHSICYEALNKEGAQ